MSYRIFVRNWWKNNAEWPNGLEPDHTAKKNYIDEAETEDEARAICRAYNKEHEPGHFSRKAAYEEHRRHHAPD